jgi:bifunctional non-homologous end joining protein LigD
MTAVPQWVRPQLTQLVDAAPEGDQWLHEIKYDGYRMHARLDRGRGQAADPHRARLDA